jgi:hypothetical protein
MPHQERDKRRLDPGREETREVPTLTGRPRVLLAVADPVDLVYHHLKELKGDQVRDSLYRTLSASMDCRPLNAPVTLAQLHEALQSGRYHVLHLVAHGLPSMSGSPGLVFEKGRGLAERVQNKHLVEILAEAPGVRLIVLMACHSHPLAKELFRQGIPAVIATRREIGLPALSVFAKAFYPPLVKTGKVDIAFRAARKALLADADTRSYVKDIELWSNHERLWRRPQLHWLRAAALAIPLLLNEPVVPRPVWLPTKRQIPQITTDTARTKQEIPRTTPRQNKPALALPSHVAAQRDAVPAVVRQRIQAAQRYLQAGLYEQSYRMYQEALEELEVSAPGISKTLNRSRLRELGKNPLAEEAAREFATLLDPLAEEPSTFNSGDVP